MSTVFSYVPFSEIPLGEVPSGEPINPKEPPVADVALVHGQKREGIWYTVGTVSATWRDDLVVQKTGGRLFVQVKPILADTVAVMLT